MMKSRLFQPLIFISLCIIITITTIGSPDVVFAAQNQDHDLRTQTIEQGFKYLASQMNEDGGIRWMDESSDTATTIRVVIALAAAGFQQDYLVSKSGRRPIDFLNSSAINWIKNGQNDSSSINVARAGQLLVATAAANKNPYQFSEDAIDLVYMVKSNYDSSTGTFGNATTDNVLDQVWAIIGLSANHASIPEEAVTWLIKAQLADGSWNDGYGSFLDTTPLVVIALIASGQIEVNNAEILTAINFIKSSQQPAGGWQTEWDTLTNANTSSMMIQAIAAVGETPIDKYWQNLEGNPRTALLSLQQEDGAIGGNFANSYSTAEAILGLSENPIFNLSHLKRINSVINYLISTQQTDGGWGSIGLTIDVMLGLYTAGFDPNTLHHNASTPLSAIQTNIDDYLANGPDAVGKVILAGVITGADLHDFAGNDLVKILQDLYNEETSGFGETDNTWHQAWAILGLRAAQAEIPEGTVNTLINLQNKDGGWEYSSGFGTWPDSTALAIQSLLAAGLPADHESILNALEYLQSMQNENGDWGDSNTTSFVLMALNALDIEPQSWITSKGRSPLAGLFTYQKPHGAFFYNVDFPDDNIMSSASALLASFSGNFLIMPPPPKHPKVNFAGLAIIPQEGDVETFCIQFSPEAVSGLDLLEFSSVEYQMQDGFIDSIKGISNPQDGTMYWSYWRWDGREWAFKLTGASDTSVTHSAIEAWAFTSWESFPSLPPLFIPNLNIMCGFRVLKDFQVQPFLNYYDLTWIAESGDFNGFLPSTVLIEEQAATTRSSAPILIIIIMGVFFFTATMVFLNRKRS